MTFSLTFFSQFYGLSKPTQDFNFNEKYNAVWKQVQWNGTVLTINYFRKILDRAHNVPPTEQIQSPESIVALAKSQLGGYHDLTKAIEQTLDEAEEKAAQAGQTPSASILDS